MNEFTAYLFIGVLVIVSAWTPLFVGRTPLSLPMVAVALGSGLALVADVGNPYGSHSPFVLHLSEFALVASVFSAGLKIDRAFSWRGWASPWRLLGVVLPLSIVGTAVAAVVLLGWPPGLALLLGAILAPTDPVLASDVGTGPPGHGEEGETKFALTAEAGLNDGVAFPFVMLGLILFGAANFDTDLLHWLMIDLIGGLAGGAAVGVALGWLVVRLNQVLPESMRLSVTDSGLVALGLAFLAYGAALGLHCNGLVAVFCEAVAIRNFSRRYAFSERLNHAAEQFERLAMVAVLFLLGISLVADRPFAVWRWRDIVFVAVLFVAVRPFTVLAGFFASGTDRWTRLALGYFGIRGIASLYYLTFAVAHLGDRDAQRLTGVVGLAVVVSVALYGITGDFAVRYMIPDAETEVSAPDTDGLIRERPPQ